MLKSMWNSMLPYDLFYKSQGTCSLRLQVGDIDYIKKASSYNEEQQPGYLEQSLRGKLRRKLYTRKYKSKAGL